MLWQQQGGERGAVRVIQTNESNPASESAAARHHFSRSLLHVFLSFLSLAPLSLQLLLSFSPTCSNRVDLLPVPVLICANKFDTLKSTEPESLRILARTLRALAHSNGASLLYTSRAHRDTLLKNYRARLTAHVMASSSGGGKAAAPSLDHTQHISLHAGQDSFAQIGDAPGKDAQAKGPVAAWMAAFPKYFEGGPQDAEEGAVMEELTLEPERSVDAALALRQEDLRRLQRELALRRKLLAQEADGPTVMAANAARMR